MFPLSQPVAIFLLVLAIILVVPAVFNRLKIPYIIGLIMAGMVVGPYGFNILARDASFEIFGQVGILYLMFLAAVEIDMYHLRLNSRAGILFGLVTFALPFVGLVFASRWWLDASWPTAFLIAAMGASHTLITYPAVSRFGLTNTRAAIIAVFGTVLAVLLALFVLAEITATSSGRPVSVLQLLFLVGRMLVYALLSAWLVPKITRYFFRVFMDPVTQFIYILAMVLLLALVAQLIGLEAILGAFYAGLLLNRFIPTRSALIRRIEFVGNAIFIPYFLIGVGMLINISVITRGPGALIAVGVMTGVSLLGKWLAALITQKVFRLDAVGRRLIFGLTSGKAAATIAAVMIGFEYGLLSEDLMNGAVVMILLCCVVASLVTERAAIRMRMQLTERNLDNPSATDLHASRQLVAVANPITAEGIMKLAVMMRDSRNPAPIYSLFVRTSDDPTVLAMGRNAMQLAVDAAESADIRAEQIERYDANIVAGVSSVIKEKDCTEVVIGMHRKSNIVDTFYGNMIEQLLRSTNRMVTMTRCFVPLVTVRRITVLVPQKAEYETGFRRWVERVASLGVQIGAKVIFCAPAATVPYIQGVLMAGEYSFSHEYRSMESWDDFLLLSRDISDEDLMIVIGARRSSISFRSALESLPEFLSKYYANQNIIVIYPEQFGDYTEMPAPIDPLTQTFVSTPSPTLLSVRRWRNILADVRNRLHSRR